VDILFNLSLNKRKQIDKSLIAQVAQDQEIELAPNK
jgi:hypothetical protein